MQTVKIQFKSIAPSLGVDLIVLVIPLGMAIYENSVVGGLIIASYHLN
jgi:hypothetical protein